MWWLNEGLLATSQPNLDGGELRPRVGRGLSLPGTGSQASSHAHLALVLPRPPRLEPPLLCTPAPEMSAELTPLATTPMRNEAREGSGWSRGWCHGPALRAISTTSPWMVRRSTVQGQPLWPVLKGIWEVIAQCDRGPSYHLHIHRARGSPLHRGDTACLYGVFVLFIPSPGWP